MLRTVMNKIEEIKNRKELRKQYEFEVTKAALIRLREDGIINPSVLEVERAKRA